MPPEFVSLNIFKTYFYEPKLRFEVAETVEIGHIIGRVLARNDDFKNFTYKLVDDSEGNFQVNNLTGEISIKKKLDYEKRSNIYNLKIFAIIEDSDLENNPKSYAEENAEVLVEVLDKLVFVK